MCVAFCQQTIAEALLTRGDKLKPRMSGVPPDLAPDCCCADVVRWKCLEVCRFRRQRTCFSTVTARLSRNLRQSRQDLWLKVGQVSPNDGRTPCLKYSTTAMVRCLLLHLCLISAFFHQRQHHHHHQHHKIISFVLFFSILFYLDLED